MEKTISNDKKTNRITIDIELKDNNVISIRGGVWNSEGVDILANRQWEKLVSMDEIIDIVHTLLK